MRVLLIAGGWSDEREVSLVGAKGIEKALVELNYEVDFLDPAKEFDQILDRATKADFAFINLHGAPGEDGLIQAMLNKTSCPYQGSSPESSFLTLNKAATKTLLDANNIRTPKWELICKTSGCKKEVKLNTPVFIKPNCGGSSIGTTLATDSTQVEEGINKVFEIGDSALVEEYIEGVEVTCPILDEEPLPIILITPPKDAPFFDYNSKYAADGAEEICPAPISEELTKEIQDLTLKAHKLLNLKGYSRADFLIADGKPYLLEINTLPGMTPTSLVPKAAKAVGYSFKDLIKKLIDLGLQ